MHLMSGLSSNELPKRVGLIAGWGRFPILVAEALLRQGIEVHVVGIKGHADEELKRIGTTYREFGVAKLGGQRKHFAKLGVTHATMAGKIFKTIMFHRFVWIKHAPDLASLSYLIPHFITGSSDRRDDSLLLTAVRAFADRGITLLPATDLAPELLVKEGLLSNRKPTVAEQQDIEFGWRMAKEMGRLDVGQSIVVKRQVVIAVEAVEGTDECIRRSRELCPTGGMTLVKVTKPQQDMRFDVPTIGLGTLERMHEAGVRVLAIEADRTIFLDQPEVVEFANRHQMSIIACNAEQFEQRKVA